MKKEFSYQRREKLLFLTTNMAAVTSRANQQYRIAFRVGTNSPRSHGLCVQGTYCFAIDYYFGALIKSINK